jgi:hypothetical protein
MLTVRQIDRYSRQIIAPGFGGSAQERLLASRMLVSGRRAELDPILPYLVGAGVGSIALELEPDGSGIAALQKRFADLNGDTRVTAADQDSAAYDLILHFASEHLTATRLDGRAEANAHAPLIHVRFGAAPAIAIMPSRPPCLICADAALITPLGSLRANPSVAAMMAAVEAIKLLAGIAPPGARLIQFDGYAATSRPLLRRSGTTACDCPRQSPDAEP